MYVKERNDHQRIHHSKWTKGRKKYTHKYYRNFVVKIENVFAAFHSMFKDLSEMGIQMENPRFRQLKHSETKLNKKPTIQLD